MLFFTAVGTASPVSLRQTDALVRVFFLYEGALLDGCVKGRCVNLSQREEVSGTLHYVASFPVTLITLSPPLAKFFRLRFIF